jgi:hypothetical protein
MMIQEQENEDSPRDDSKKLMVSDPSTAHIWQNKESSLTISPDSPKHTMMPDFSQQSILP